MDIHKKPHVVFWGHLEKSMYFYLYSNTVQTKTTIGSNQIVSMNSLPLPSLINLATCQANHLLLYDQNWVTEGTDMLMEEKPAASAE